MHTRLRTAQASLAALALAACLPEGRPGIGRQIAHQQDVDRVWILPPREGRPLVVLHGRPTGDPPPPTQAIDHPLELHATREGEGEKPALLGAPVLPFRDPIVDRRGRLYVRAEPRAHGSAGGAETTAKLVRLDLAASPLERTELGEGVAFALSPDGDRLARRALTPDGQRLLLLRGEDEIDVALGADPRRAAFFGAHLHYVLGSERALFRLGPAPGASAERLAAGVDLVEPLDAGDPPRLLVSRQSPTTRAWTMAVLDPSTPAEGSFPGRRQSPVLAVSLDGRRAHHLEDVTAGGARLHVTDLATLEGRMLAELRAPDDAHAGADRRLAPLSVASQIVERPGRAEIWILHPRRTWIVREAEHPRELPTTISLHPFLYDGAPDPERDLAGPFTRDGRQFVGVDGERNVEAPRLFLGDADDPLSGRRLPLAPPGVPVPRAAELDERHLLVWRDNQQHLSDLYLFDRQTGEARLLAATVGRVAIGGRRAVLLAGVSARYRTGDLVAVEYATGATSILGHNVSAFALAPACAACDQTELGGRIAYAVRGRVPSPQDGVWTAVLP